MQWLGPSLIYLTSPPAVAVTLWGHRRHPIPLLSISLVGLSLAEFLFIAGLTTLGVAHDGLQFFVNVFGVG